VADGITKIAADGQPPASGELVFNLAGSHLGSGAADLGRLLLITSLAAALISFHNTTSRYMFALGRERLLPRVFGSTSSSGSPRVASLTQSVLAVATILVFAVGGYDPLVTLFYTGGAAGGLALVALMAIASVAVVVFFARDLRGETQWHGRIAPSLSIVVMVSVLVLVVTNMQTLLGVGPDSPLPWAIPLVLLVVALAGLIWGLVLKVRRPDIYSRIGLGAKSALTSTSLPSPYSGQVVHDGPTAFRVGGYDQ
jgi:amino acid transporter